MAAGDILCLNGSLAPARSAAKFIGTGDEACLIDTHAVARQTAADTAGTYTEWINIPDITGTYGIVSCGDTAAIEFISLRVEAGKITVECNDATVDQFEHTTTNVVITPHKWHHIALVQDATLNAPKIYVDGDLITEMTATLETDNAAWFGQCQLIDDGSIGASEEAGAAGQIDEMIGAISDVKYWNTNLSATEVLRDYQGATPANINSNLTDWWKMEDLTNEVTAANPIVKGASILFVKAYSEFTSKVAHSGVIVADDISISTNDQLGTCFVVKAA